MKRYVFTLIAVLLLAGQAMAQYTESPIAHLSRADGTFYVGAGSGRIVAETGVTALASLGLTANGRSLVMAENYAAMKTLLAYGTMADQAASSVAITGGTINGATIGATTPAAGAFTTLEITPGPSVAPTDNGDVTIDFPTATTLRLRGKNGDTVRNLTLPITNTALTDGYVLKVATGTPTWAADTDTTYTAGDGLDLTGTDFDLDLKAGGGLEIDTGELKATAALLTGEIGLSWHGTAAEVIDDAVVCPYSGTITSVIITANASGSIELDVWKSASGVPTVADTICNASYPALSAAQQDKAISVAGWSSTAITAGDTIKFEVRSVSTITQATVQLVIAK
jgi:hypothetical protein